jgi:hypothetical protein
MRPGRTGARRRGADGTLDESGTTSESQRQEIPPDTVALKDSERAFTYPELQPPGQPAGPQPDGLGLAKGDRVAVLLENSIEIVELYLATAKTGLVIVPINFRLVAPDVAYIVDNSDAKALVVHDEFTPDGEQDPLRTVPRPEDKLFVVGQAVDGYRPYEGLIAPVRTANRMWPWPVRHLDPDLHLRNHRQAQGCRALPRVPLRVLPDQRGRFRFQRTRHLPERHAAVPHQLHLLHLHLHLHRRLGGTFTRPARSGPARSWRSSNGKKSAFISLIPTHYNLILNAPAEAGKTTMSAPFANCCAPRPRFARA